MTSSGKQPPQPVNPPPGELNGERSLLVSLHEILAEAYQPIEFRSNVKLWGAAILALGLWSLIGSIAWNQFQATKEYATKLTDLVPSVEGEQVSLVHQEKVRQIEKSIAMIDSTADRLYTFLSPVVTAVTGYFFVAAGSRPRSGPPSSGNSQ